MGNRKEDFLAWLRKEWNKHKICKFINYIYLKNQILKGKYIDGGVLFFDGLVKWGYITDKQREKLKEVKR